MERFRAMTTCAASADSQARGGTTVKRTKLIDE